MRKMLIPLDGSAPSETALPVAAAVAGAAGYEISLLAVWEVESDQFLRVSARRVEDLTRRGMEYLRTYLGSVARRLEERSLSADICVRSGYPPAEILNAARDLDAQMIAMATHSRRTVAERRRGSVADKVLRGSTIPVLAVGPLALARAGETPAVRRIAVPLDGTPESESSLPLAIELAQALGAQIDLLRVVPRLFEMYHEIPIQYEPDIDEVRVRVAGAYLEKLRTRHPEVAQTHLRGGFTREEVRKFLEEEPADLVVMASRTRREALPGTLGGVADEVIEGPCPVLLVYASAGRRKPPGRGASRWKTKG